MLNSYVFSYFDYCISIYGISCNLHFAELQKLLDKLIIIYEYPNLAKIYFKRNWNNNQGTLQLYRKKHSINMTNLYEKFDIFTFKERFMYFNYLNIFKLLKFNCNNIDCLKDEFVLNKISRRKFLNVIPHKTKFFEKSFRYYGTY